MTILKSPLSSEQWSLYAAFNAERQAGEWFTILPGMPLRYWLNKREYHDVFQARGGSLAKMRRIISAASILMSVVKKEGDDICLGLAITDDEFTQSLLRNAGVKVVPWEQAQRYMASPRNLTLDAEKAISKVGHKARLPIHTEENNLRRELMTTLNMWWGRHAGIRDVMTPNTRDHLNCHMQFRRSQLAVLWEVALSRFIDRETLESHAKVGREPEMIEFSSVDLLVCATAADGIPILAVEYDGILHQTDPDKIANDKAKDSLFAQAGLAILRIRSNEGRAGSVKQHGMEHPVSPRLLPMLEIARHMVDEKLKSLAQADIEAEMFQRRVTRWTTLAHSLYGKPFQWLDEQELNTVMAQSVDFDALSDDLETKAESAIADAEERRYWSLDGQLHLSRVDRELIEDFCIVEKGDARVAKGQLRIPGSHTLRSIETVAVKLRIPNIEDEKITDLENMQLYFEFASEAKKQLSAASRKP